jgi:hypothetical protein
MPCLMAATDRIRKRCEQLAKEHAEGSFSRHFSHPAQIECFFPWTLRMRCPIGNISWAWLFQNKDSSHRLIFKPFTIMDLRGC